jgi:hypothetical protein
MMSSLKTQTESRYPRKTPLRGLRQQRPGKLSETVSVLVLTVVLMAAWAIAVGI